MSALRAVDRVHEPTTPHDIDAERALLGAILLENDAFPRASAIVSSEEFWRETHRWLFAGMSALHQRQEPIDLTTLRAEIEPRKLEEIGLPYITALVDGMPRSSNVEHYARIVKGHATRRAAIYIATRLIADAHDGDIPDALSDAQQAIRTLADGTVANEAVSTPLAEILSRTVETMRQPILGDVLALGEIGMLHGQPRDGKTWASLEIAVALAIQGQAFGLARLSAAHQCNVLIVSNEDGERVYANRLQMLLAGRGIFTAPENIYLLIGQGCDLDDPVWQRRLVRECLRLGITLVIFDPLRSLTACVDQGPSDLQPFAQFLRRFIRETGVAVLLVHHDTKPPSGVAETRRRAQRASGGAIFSIVDSPLHVERVDERRSLVAPDGFKHCADPDSFVFERRVSEDGTTVRLLATDTGTAISATDVALQAKILAVLQEMPGASGRVIAREVKTHRQVVADTLERMFKAGLVDAVDGARNARLWRAL